MKRHTAGWRITLAAGCIAAFAAMSPLIAAADEDRPCPSGAVIALGGVSNGHGHRRPTPLCDGEDVSFAGISGQLDGDTDQQPDDGLSIAQAGEARPLVLPNTGGGPVEDQDPGTILTMFVSAMALGTGGYFGVRRLRHLVQD